MISIYFTTWLGNYSFSTLSAGFSWLLFFFSFCYLPEYYGLEGVTTFLEDCPYKNLSRYDTLPMIAKEQFKEGIHPKVCCPDALPDDHICTPSDPWCPSYVVSLCWFCSGHCVNPHWYYQKAPEKQKFKEKNPTLPTVGERSCKPYGSYANLPNFSSSNLTECVTLNRYYTLYCTKLKCTVLYCRYFNCAML